MTTLAHRPAARGPAAAESPRAARWCAGRGACSAASGASRSWCSLSSPSRSRPRSPASRSPTTRARRTMPSSARPINCSGLTAPIRAGWRRVSPPPRNASGQSTSSVTARWPCPAASTRSSSAPRTRTERTGAHGLRCAEASIRTAPARLRSPTAWPRSSGSSSGRRLTSTAAAGASSASSRTHAI